MRRALLALGKCLGFLGVWTLLLAAVVMSTVGFAGPDWYRSIGWRLWVEIGGTLATLAALVFMARVVDKRGFSTLGFNLDRSVIGVLTGTILGAGVFAAALGLMWALGYARFAPDLGGFNADAMALGLVLCFFNVVTQQALVRSYIFQEVWTKFGAAAAIAVTTLLFVALHAAALIQGENGLIAGVNIAVASVMFGLAYVRSGALWLPIGIHMGWNGLQGPVLRLDVTGADVGFGSWQLFDLQGPPLLTGGAIGVEGGIIGLIGPVLGLAIVALAVRPRSNAS